MHRTMTMPSSRNKCFVSRGQLQDRRTPSCSGAVRRASRGTTFVRVLHLVGRIVLRTCAGGDCPRQAVSRLSRSAVLLY